MARPSPYPLPSGPAPFGIISCTGVTRGRAHRHTRSHNRHGTHSTHGTHNTHGTHTRMRAGMKTYMHTHTNLHLQLTYACTRIHAHEHAPAHERRHGMCEHAHLHAHLRAHDQASTYTRPHTCIQTRIRSRGNIRARTRAHARTHTHMCTSQHLSVYAQRIRRCPRLTKPIEPIVGDADSASGKDLEEAGRRELGSIEADESRNICRCRNELRVGKGRRLHTVRASDAGIGLCLCLWCLWFVSR